MVYVNLSVFNKKETGVRTESWTAKQLTQDFACTPLGSYILMIPWFSCRYTRSNIHLKYQWTAVCWYHTSLCYRTFHFCCARIALRTQHCRESTLFGTWNALNRHFPPSLSSSAIDSGSPCLNGWSDVHFHLIAPLLYPGFCWPAPNSARNLSSSLWASHQSNPLLEINISYLQE